MRIQLATGLLLPLVFVFLSTPIGHAASPEGSKCTKAGLVITSGGKKLTCSLVWTAAAPTVAPKKAAKKSTLLQDKSFRLETVSFNEDFGSAGAAARVTNISSKTRTAILEITIFKTDGRTIAANLVGNVNAVSPGQTVTVTFMSVNGVLPSGRFQYTFQVSAEF